MRSSAEALASAYSPQEQEPTAYSARFKQSSTSYAELVDETNVALGGSATFTGATFNVILSAAGAVVTAGNAGLVVAAYIAWSAFANQAGTVNVQYNYSGVATWRTFVATAIVASTLKNGVQNVLGVQYGRTTYVNGAAAQATFEYRTLIGDTE